MLTQLQLAKVCQIHQGAAECRYLKVDPTDYSKHYCVKLRTTEKAQIDKACKTHEDACKKNGIDPKSTGHPLGDNCPGYPLLKHVLQGFDHKP